MGLGNVCLWQGRYTNAIGYYQRALQIYENAFGVDHIKTADMINNLGSMYHSQGKYDEAIAQYERALRIYENANHTLEFLAKQSQVVCCEFVGDYISMNQMCLSILSLNPFAQDLTLRVASNSSVFLLSLIGPHSSQLHMLPSGVDLQSHPLVQSITSSETPSIFLGLFSLALHSMLTLAAISMEIPP